MIKVKKTLSIVSILLIFLLLIFGILYLFDAFFYVPITEEPVLSPVYSWIAEDIFYTELRVCANRNILAEADTVYILDGSEKRKLLDGFYDQTVMDKPARNPSYDMVLTVVDNKKITYQYFIDKENEMIYIDLRDDAFGGWAYNQLNPRQKMDIEYIFSHVTPNNQ